MDSRESCVPPGFRFHPTDEELVGYYLMKKVASQKIDLDVIRDIDLYRIEPWDLQDRCGMGYEEQKEWYFFSHKDKKYPTGSRTNRATLAGFWKATGRDKAVYDKCKLIGMRKTLVFYKGRAPNGLKTDWIMHEYRLESQENASPQEEGWVVCRAFKKRTTNVQSKTLEGWDSSYVYDETSAASSVIDPIHDFVTKQPQSPSFFSRNLGNKQEVESSTLAYFMNSSSVDQFLQLPLLESPSSSQLPLLKPASSLISHYNDNNNGQQNHSDNIVIGDKVSDWRVLDKFVASQLSQDPEFVGGDNNNKEISNFDNNIEECSNSDIEDFLLLHGSNTREDVHVITEGNKLMCDSGNIGFSMFNK